MKRFHSMHSAGKKRLREISRFSRYLWPYWDKQAVLYLCMGFSVLLGLVSPYLTQLVIDYALLGRDLLIFNLLLIVGIVSYLFSIPLGLIQRYTGFYLRTRVAFTIRSRFYRHLQLLSLRFAQSRSAGEHLYRLGPDLEGVVGLIVDTIPTTLVFFFRFILLLTICLYLSWKLTLILLLVSPLIYLHAHYFTRKQYALGKTITETSQGISSRLQQAIAQMKLIKIFGRERGEYRRYLKDMIGLIRLNIRNVRIGILQGESGRLMTAALTGGISYFLGYQIIKGRMTLGQLTALTMYLYQLLSAIKSAGNLYQDFVMKFIAMDRVVQTLDAEIEVKEASRGRKPWDGDRTVRFQDVTFGYVRERPVLRRVNFELGPAKTIALVGPSGAGKSTLCYLLLRLYDPWSGSVLQGGVDLRALNISQFRKSIGFAEQEPSLLQGSVGENIAFGDPEASERDVLSAATVAQVHEFACRLPLGYDTQIGPGGVLLSQGQRQRIAIARAAVMRPKILILDEAMSSVDSACEQRILAALRQFLPETCLLLISHRLSVVREADRIVVLGNGSIEAQGTHSELFSGSGTYYDLYREQQVSVETPPLHRAGSRLA